VEDAMVEDGDAGDKVAERGLHVSAIPHPCTCKMLLTLLLDLVALLLSS